MHKGFTFAAAAALFAVATPAAATVTVNTNSGSTILNVGGSTTINFQGVSDGISPTGLTNTLQLTLTSQSATQSVFAFTLANTSSAPVTASRVSTFGFDVDPTLLNATVTSAIFTGIGSGSIANGRSVEVCFTANNNCAGGGNDGVAIGSSTSGSFTLNFTGGASNITLSNFATRFQAISGAGAVSSATGTTTRITTAVPEPGTWAMMLVGFGGMGVAMRRSRRKRAHLLQAA